jgi:hydrogenase maturation protease
VRLFSPTPLFRVELAAMNTLVLGLGNELLSDDAVGLLVAEELQRHLAGNPDVHVVCAQVAGFRLVDILAGYQRAIVVDAIISDRAPAGEVYWLDRAELRRPLLNRSNHNIHLADALQLGERLGLEMPNEVKVLAVEVEDCFTLAEGISEAAEKAVPKAVGIILDELGCRPSEV